MISDFDPEGFYDDDWSDCGDLAWNEFDWERYLRVQDESLHRYLAFYESLPPTPNRIDEVARRMGWGEWEGHENKSPLGENPAAAPQPSDAPKQAASGTTAAVATTAAAVSAREAPPTAIKDGEAEAAAAESEEPSHEFGSEYEVYTLHKNPVYITTRALYLRLHRNWELLAATPGKVPADIALPYLSSLHSGEVHALQAIQALDFSDYAMCISLFKRALATLNQSLTLLAKADSPAARDYAENMRPSLFDLREIWLRISRECRQEFEHWLKDEEDEED